MVIRRSDPRRRRVGILREDHDNGAEKASSTAAARPVKKASKKETPITAYGVSAKRRHLTKTSDLIPKRLLPFLLVSLAVILGVAVINWLYMFATQMTEIVGVRALEAFSLTARGSLSQWFTTMLLIVSGMASLQIYALRQHRSDDYRGTYRLWFWLSMLFLFASVDAAVGLHDIALNAISYFTGRPMSHGSWALVTIKLVALTALVVRGIVEVRESKGTLIAVLFVWFAYAGAILMQLPQAQTGTVFKYEAVYGNLYLFGTVALFQSLVLYSRYVFMSAQGLLLAKPEVKSAANSVSKAQQKAEAKAAAKAKAKAEADAKAQAKLDAKAQAKAEIEAKAAAKANAKAEAIAQAKADIEAKAAAKQKARDDAKAAIEAKARAKVDSRAAKKATKKSGKAKQESTDERPATVPVTSRPKRIIRTRPQTSESQAETETADQDASPLAGKLSKRKLKKKRKAEQRQQNQRRAA